MQCHLNMAFVLMMDKTRSCVLYENTIECKTSNRQPSCNAIEFDLAFKENAAGIVAADFVSGDSKNILSERGSVVAGHDGTDGDEHHQDIRGWKSRPRGHSVIRLHP